MQPSPIKNKGIDDRAIQYIFERIEPAEAERDEARRQVGRARDHVAKIETLVSSLPGEVEQAEKQLNDYIAAGRPTDHVEKKLLLLRNALTAKESWLNKQSDKFLNDTAQKQKLAEMSLQKAITESCNYCKPEFLDKGDGIIAMFWDGVYLKWVNVMNALKARGLPLPLGNFPIDISGFITTLKGRGELDMFKREFIDAFPVAVARSKYAVQDALLAKTKAPPAKPKRKTGPVSVVAIELSEADIVSIVEEMTGVKLPKRRLVDVKVTSDNAEDMTRKLTREAIKIKLETDGPESIQQLKEKPRQLEVAVLEIMQPIPQTPATLTAEEIRESRVDAQHEKAQKNPILTMTPDELDASDIEVQTGVIV